MLHSPTCVHDQTLVFPSHRFFLKKTSSLDGNKKRPSCVTLGLQCLSLLRTNGPREHQTASFEHEKRHAPTKKAAVHCDGDSDRRNSHECDCNAAAGRTKWGERVDGDDKSKSRRMGDKRCFAQNECQGEGDATVLSSRKELRKDYERGQVHWL